MSLSGFRVPSRKFNTGSRSLSLAALYSGCMSTGRTEQQSQARVRGAGDSTATLETGTYHWPIPTGPLTLTLSCTLTLTLTLAEVYVTGTRPDFTSCSRRGEGGRVRGGKGLEIGVIPGQRPGWREVGLRRCTCRRRGLPPAPCRRTPRALGACFSGGI